MSHNPDDFTEPQEGLEPGGVILTDTSRETLEVKDIKDGVLLIHETKGAFPDVRTTTVIELSSDEIWALIVYLWNRRG